MASENVTAHLAKFVVQLDAAKLDNEILDAAKVLIMDGLGVMVAGASHPVAAILLEYANQIGGREECLLLGGNRTSPTMAAFVHGCMLHVNDFEIQGAVPTHGTSNLLPPALAFAEKQGNEGIDLIGAVIAGWEVMSRIRASGPKDLGGFHPPGQFGPFGAAAVSGKMLGLTAEQQTYAFGIAGSRTGGLFANNGTMVKSTHPGNAGRMGVESAMLAKLGFDANDDILGAKRGFVHTLFKGQLDTDKLLGGLEDARYLVDPGFTIKYQPAEVGLQRIIEAAGMVKKENNLQLDDIVNVELEVAHIHEDLMRPNPKTGLDGKFSYHYSVAVALVEDYVGVRSYSDETRFSAPLEAALKKVTVKDNHDIPEGLHDTWVTVRATVKDGTVYEYTVKAFKGSPGNPLTRDERHTKFKDCTAQAWTPTETQQAIELVESLEKPGQLAKLIDLLKVASEKTKKNAAKK